MLFVLTLGIGWISVPQWLHKPILWNGGLGIILFVLCIAIIFIGDRSDELTAGEYNVSGREFMSYRELSTRWLFVAFCCLIFGIPGLMGSLLILYYIPYKPI